MKIFTYLFSLISFYANAQLEKGDLAIVGFNSDSSPDRMAIVALAEIPSGQTIYISDFRWLNSGAFNATGTTEGAITWSTSSTVPAGTILNITFSSDGTPTIGGDLSAYGSVSTTGWTSSSSATVSGGDNWFIYQGASPSSVPTNWVFGWNNWSTNTHGQNSWMSTGTPSATTSYLPPNLTNGVNAIALSGVSGGSHNDNMVYTGVQSGDKATVLTAICTTSNWNGSETVLQDLSVGGTNFTGTQPIFTISGTLSISSPHIGDKVLIYPNPTSKIVNIDLNISKGVSINVYNGLGQIIKSDTNVKTNKYQLELIGNQQLYFVEIIDSQGNKAYSKILKK
ncbi:T9SS type A sorting domain-containing protein [Flavivirga rizhaonensis]|uniref:T9SS type A sorting domain-containing protein n=1 Tax=Flavivirga rizhaonensis TaxID=2559571 RepID=A0A4S1DRY7_9FLAO|nr:T9SS type A sorting domain-containing protein [Flavivirga rizhaonensis]TGV00493.1 T9SS type A sorting domain-containing protein [Flavivirga rizhaonensis]